MEKGIQNIGYKDSLEPEKFPKTKFLWLILIVVIIAVVVFLVFFSEGKNGDGSDIPGFDDCETLSTETQVNVCKIELMEELGEVSICDEDFGEAIFGYIFRGEFEYRPMDVDDYCWLKASLSKGVDYCDKILEGEIKVLCKGELEFLEVVVE